MRGSETLPFNAIASGHVFLAFAGPDHLAKGLAQPMPRFTATTCATTTELQGLIQRAVMVTAVDLTRKLGHEPPPAYLALLPECGKTATLSPAVEIPQGQAAHSAVYSPHSP